MTRLLAPLLLISLGFAAFTAPACDIAAASYEMMQKELKPDEWQKFVKKTRRTFDSWCNDYPDGSFKRFLDDRLLNMAMGALDGDVKALKKVVIWVALYKEFSEPVPSYLREVEEKYGAEIDEVMKNFTWEKAAERIKNRSNERKKEMAREERRKKKKDD